MINRALRDGHGFTGHIEDAQTGLNYMQQRYYDPAIGRFLSVDPVTANSGTGANFNRYWYANNNPYIFTDPDGRQPRRGEMNLCGTPGLCGTTDNASIMAANGGGRGGGGGTGENASVGLSKPAQGRPATSGNHQTLPVDEIDHEKWTKAAEMEPGDKLVIDSKGGIIVQPRAIAGPLPTFQFGYRVTQRPLTANGKIEAYVASPAWGKPEFYSSGFTGFLDRGGMQFFAPGGAGGNRWLIDFSGQESTHDNVVYPSLIIYTPLP